MWIETRVNCQNTIVAPSRPSRACGLKHSDMLGTEIAPGVTPLAGVWIETLAWTFHALTCRVTPLAGVWIETYRASWLSISISVTPLAGVWIETISALNWNTAMSSHAPRGRVD